LGNKVKVQITFSAEQVEEARKVFEFLIWPAFGWIARHAYKKLVNSINKFITDNVNRIKNEIVDELSGYIDVKFQDHESSAFSRITALEILVKKGQSGNSN
jgi:hypothetical protein